MSKMISTLTEINAIREYLNRIDAEARSLRTAVVTEKNGQYWQDIAVIRFEPNGEIKAPDAFLPTSTESAKIIEEMKEFEFPTLMKKKRLSNLPKSVAEAKEENVFVFRDEHGDITMIQLRLDDDKGGKRYIPYTFWSDGKWRAAEPDGLLPLWGLDKLGDNTTVFIHEGAKSARAMQKMVEAETYDQKDKLAAHPWGAELTGATHLAWIGGALCPSRTDWKILKRLGVQRCYIVSDNDPAGVSAVAPIAFHLYMPTFHVQFTSEWPASFDLADEFPDSMFAQIDDVKYYTGPTFKTCVHPATWATDQVPNKKGKPTTVIRKHFREMWAYIEDADMFVCTEMPEIIRPDKIANNMFSAFSHVTNTTTLLLRSYCGRSVKVCYRPDVKGRLVSESNTSAINMHIPTTIKSKEGNPKPFLNFMEYLFPNEAERIHTLRWCATLIARPDIKMNFGLLLVSELQGTGKTTLGEHILAKLVGAGNASFPSEQAIVGSAFNEWLANKRLVIVSEIYSGHSWKAYNQLKGYITDRTIDVNVKFQRPYSIENWAHFVAMSNSMRALRMEKDDRRWFYPEVTETRWQSSKFRDFYKWLNSGGLSIIKHWAENFEGYVVSGEHAPMTARKRELIEESRTDAQKEVVDLARATIDTNLPIAIAMHDVKTWVRSTAQGKVFDSDHELRKSMKDAGMVQSKVRYKLKGKNQYALLTPALAKSIEGKTTVDAGNEIRKVLKKPESIIEEEM